MKRALALLAVLLLTGCPGVGGWNDAIEAYQARTPIVDSGAPDSGPVGFPLDSRCGANADCESGQCRNGVCITPKTFGGGLPCGDFDDCRTGDICQPEGAAAVYQCAIPDGGCAPTGKLCKTNGDCGFSGSCTSGCNPEGMCQNLQCKTVGVSCGQHKECCGGFLCGGPPNTSGADGGFVGTCVPNSAGTLDAGTVCQAPGQCATGGCTTSDPKVCIAPSTCTRAGSNGCFGTCCTGLTCVNATCCAGFQKACQTDIECCSGQCLAGFCLDSKITEGAKQFDNCRMLSQACGDDNDCCTGLCHTTEKQCTLRPMLNDGGACMVDIRTKKCAALLVDGGIFDGGTGPGGLALCSTPTASCSSNSDCCNGAQCNPTTGSCF